MDLNMRVKRFPAAGETVLSQSYSMTPGGKGANQALAAARIGSKTALVGKVGDDGAGLRVLNYLKRHEVMTSGVATSEELPTGMATVMRDASGENSIVVASGANAEVSAEQVPSNILGAGNVLLCQMEISLEQNALVMKTAHDTGAKVIMNLAPAVEIPQQLLTLVDYLIVNQIEARQLAKTLKINVQKDSLRKDSAALAKALAKENNMTCIVTMGAEGVVAVEPNGKGFSFPALKIQKAVDTAGAGDCFCGTFAACLHEGRTLITAVKMATVASGLSCQTKGIMKSYPYLSDIEEAMETMPKAASL